MKHIFLMVNLLAFISLDNHSQRGFNRYPHNELNLFIITVDGFRWQEVFLGADSAIISDETLTPDASYVKTMYWSPDYNERRKKLLPFFWNVIASQGQIYGNRNFGNKINVANFYDISYAGYNELMTGTSDPLIYSNDKKENRNINLLEFLDSREDFHGKVAAFTSWDVFPYILNENRNSLPVNSGYEQIDDPNLTGTENKINAVQSLITSRGATRQDRLTFIAAKEYAEKNHPRVLYLALGETDEYAHHRRYDRYLEKAADMDRMIAELWHWTQTTDGYRNNTLFLITTDHGRGSSFANWSNHGLLTPGSSQTWMACLGPGIDSLGELKTRKQYYSKQMVTTFSRMLGVEFKANNKSIAEVAHNR